MVQLKYTPYQLNFKFAAGTSRGVLHKKDSVLLKANFNGVLNYGEASFIPGLSTDTKDDIIHKLKSFKSVSLEDFKNKVHLEKQLPALQFALESILQQYPENDFSKGIDGIPINGLIWMGKIDDMQKQIQQKINDGFRVIKLKIGAIKWNEELELLTKIRATYNKQSLEIRVDANGAFEMNKVYKVLDQLHRLDIHSIEQPIKNGQIKNMQRLCAETPIPIALDEELIGIQNYEKKHELISTIKPQYLILKPGLLGGFKSCEDWIKIAQENNAGYWITSALESNIGLNAIAQWTYQLGLDMPQGLGTGGLFTNNIPSPLEIKYAKLYYNPNKQWDYSCLNQNYTTE